ncbi:MAG: VOC family protein [Myxococcota bacterium]
MPQLTTLQPMRPTNPTVRVNELLHLVVERPDPNAAKPFLMDFGLRIAREEHHVLYLRATGPSAYCYRVQRGPRPRFLGLGLAVASRQDLESLANLPGASPIQTSPHPGGGEVVVLTDPSGFLVEAVFGHERVPSLPSRPPLPANLGGHPTRINVTQRSPRSPPEVLRLGHLVLEVANFQATCRWYTEHFGLLPSDVQVLPDGSPAVVFLRLDLGDVPADHHTIAIAQGFAPAFGHSAFEVVDADAVGMGQRMLQQRGFRHAWGIGRHVLGSQIFDYWADPWGAKHEHYCDGDVFTADVPMGVHAVSREAMAQWGPPMPASFTRPRITLSNLIAMVHHLRTSPDLTLSKLITLARIFA